MEIQNISVSQLKPDPKQPRRFKDQKRVEEMAVSIKNVGIINPIEIDQDFVIITGEMRWRGATLAGIKTVPCKVIQVKDGEDRFLRQVHENIHEQTMNDWDMAMALKQCSSILERVHGHRPTGQELGNEFGKSKHWIDEHLRILKQKEDLQEAVQKGLIDYTRLRPLNKTPEPYKSWMQSLVMDKAIFRDVTEKIAKEVKKLHERGMVEVIEKIKSTDWRGKSVIEAVMLLRKMIPDRVENMQQVANAIQNRIIELSEIMEKFPLEVFGTTGKLLVLPFIVRFYGLLGEYIREKAKIEA